MIITKSKPISDCIRVNPLVIAYRRMFFKEDEMNKEISYVQVEALPTNKEQIVIVYKQHDETMVSVLKPGEKSDICPDSLTFAKAISDCPGDGLLVTYQIIVPKKSA